MTYTNASHRNLLDESHTCNLLSFLQLPSAGSNNPTHASPNDGAFASPSCHRPLFEELCFVMCLDLSFTCGCDLCLDLMDCGCEFVTCGCDIWLVVAICCYLSCGCDIMCENGFVVIYIWLLWCLWYICDMWYIFELFVSVECKKQKKIAISVDLPSAMVMALDKAGKLCRAAEEVGLQRRR